jgi:hypothetical protein
VRLGAREVLADADVRARYEELSSREFVFGRSSDAPVAAARRLDFGLFEVTARFDAGELRDFAVNSDCLATEVVEQFAAALNRWKGSGTLEFQTNSSTELATLGQLSAWILPTIRAWAPERG